MWPTVRKTLARAYELTARPPGSDTPVAVKSGLSVPGFVLEWSRTAPGEANTFLDRLPSIVDLRDKSVLALGRGAGDLGIEAARRHPRRVLAIDMAMGRMALAQARLADEEGQLPVEIKAHAGSLAELGGERFDVVLAVDAFREYGAERSSSYLEERIQEMAMRLVDGGLLAAVLSSPWKSPYGGRVDSTLPWVHLIFPELVIFDEFRRVRRDNQARTFEDIGVNRVTVARFRQAMEGSGLECVHFQRNVGDRRAAAALRLLSRVPMFEEYITLNAYGVWRRPDRAGLSLDPPF